MKLVFRYWNAKCYWKKRRANWYSENNRHVILPLFYLCLATIRYFALCLANSKPDPKLSYPNFRYEYSPDRLKFYLLIFYSIHTFFTLNLTNLLFHYGGSYHIETSPLICFENHWTGFYMVGTCMGVHLIQNYHYKLEYEFELEFKIEFEVELAFESEFKTGWIWLWTWKLEFETEL